MTPQEENARILLSHATIKPEFLFHDGSTIADLMNVVQKRLDKEPEPCDVCHGSKEVTFTTGGENAWVEPCTACCEHDWRGIDTGRMCASCHVIEGAR